MLTRENSGTHWRSDPASAANAIARATEALRAAGLEGAARESRLLVAAVAGFDAAALLRNPEKRLTEPQQGLLSRYLARRIAREPVSRILGHRGFYGRDFLLTPATLDPRPESETLIDAALHLVAAEGWAASPIRILDIGTGSGCLLVTLLAELPLAEGVGTDVNPGALLAAKENAERHGVASRARFVEARSLGGVKDTFELLVANPPYIPTAEIVGLDPEVRNHDPIAALDGGSSGLDVYREIAHGLIRVVPDGWALFEVGAGQADDVAALLVGTSPTSSVRRFKDLDGRDRCVAWKARGSERCRKPLGISSAQE